MSRITMHTGMERAAEATCAGERLAGGLIALIGTDEATLTQLQEYLAAEGCELRDYGDCESARKGVIRSGVELVVIDLATFGGEAIDFCRGLKADAECRDIPVIFLQHSASEVPYTVGFDAGGVDFLTVPLDESEVVARVRTHLSMARALRALRETQEELRLSKDSFRIAHQIARLGHWEWDLDSEVLRWSDEAYRILGYTPRNSVPNREVLLRRVHAADRRMVLAQLERMFRGDALDVEFRITLPGGASRVLHARGQVACLVDCRHPHIVDSGAECGASPYKTFIGTLQDVTERKALEDQLELEAHTDALTGAATRRFFLELAQQRVRACRSKGVGMSLLMLDVDRFKRINDSYGHHAGDLALQMLVEVSRSVLRDEDVIGRLGGEEFAVLLPATNLGVAVEVAERLRAAIAAKEVAWADQAGLYLSVSIGVATLAAEDAGYGDMLNRADRALYRAKRRGRNRVCVGEAGRG